jgi:hypothetical protein
MSTATHPGAARSGDWADLAPWVWTWRADRAVQAQPEASFIPRRLGRLDRIYRTAAASLPPDQLKSIHYDMPDLLRPFPPVPAGELLLGLLWVGRLTDFQLQLSWSADSPPPAPEDLEVRSYPTAFGWFGWTVDRVLAPPEVLDQGRTLVYRNAPGELMDTAYSEHVAAGTEMLAVFARRGTGGALPPVPEARLTAAAVGRWQRLALGVEWGFGTAPARSAWEGRLCPHLAEILTLAPLTGDDGTHVDGPAQWHTRPVAGQRQGVRVELLYAPDSRPGLDSRITLESGTDTFTFSLGDLARGPILRTDLGFYITLADVTETASEFIAHRAANPPLGIRDRTRAHREAASWQEVMREVRLWTCPDGTELLPLPPVEDPPMEVDLDDRGWVDAWRAACQQLTGKHMWGGLAFEVGRVAYQMELVGLHGHAEPVYEHFLAAPGGKSDGDYLDGDGALEWATSMRHDMGYNHDGTHASTGRLLFAMAERYFLTGDRAWLQRHRERLQRAADWIIRQRRGYAAEVANRDQLHVAGLMPPSMLGDYALPACDWHWYYVDNALALQGLQRFADALAEIDPAGAAAYAAEAAAFRADLRRTVAREAAMAPVRAGRDGLYRRFVPRMAYARGLTGPELGAPQFPDCDQWIGALPLIEPGAALPGDDPCMVETLDLMEELGTTDPAVGAREQARRERGLPTEDAWFWHCYSMLPKASHTANAYLLQDDIPSFLRFWMNSYAAMVGADGKLWEHWHLGGFGPCEAPDNGTAGWFVENFRNLLVMEEGESLWVARGTPRAWLQPGAHIRVRQAPTHFGSFAGELTAAADGRHIAAILDIPARRPPKAVWLRLRHHQAAPLQHVTVNDQAWPDVDRERELIRLTGLVGRVRVNASY